MAKTTFIFAGIYIVMGIISYFASGRASATALIPAFFGVFYALFAGLSSWKESLNKHMMHASMVLTLLALGGTWGGFGKALSWLFTSAAPERLLAVQVQALFFVLSLVYLGLGIRSFIEARRAQSDAA